MSEDIRPPLDHSRRLRPRRGGGRRGDPDLPVRRGAAAAAARARPPSAAGLQAGPETEARARQLQGTAAEGQDGRTADRRGQDELRHLHIALDTKQAPKIANSFAYLTEARLLQRAHLPPDRPRIRRSRAAIRSATGAAARATASSRSRRKISPTPTAVVAMAKTGSDPSGSAGSQFYVVSGSQRRPAARIRAGSATSARAMTWSSGSANWAAVRKKSRNRRS